MKVFPEAFGNITKMAEAVGIDRGTFYNWIKSDQEFKKTIENIDPEEKKVMAIIF